MKRRPPILLWTATLLELFRLMGLTTAVMVCVIAFAAAIKPLADGKLQPGDALTFMLVAIPPMLAYVLPFAGGFAATLVYHRMATDHEITAAQAGGIGHRSLLVPAFCIAVFIAGCLAVLNEQAIPRFLRRMQELVTVDMARLLTLQTQRGRSVSLSNTAVWADDAVRREPSPASGARDRVSLSHTAMITTDKTGAVTREFFANRADLWFYSAAEASRRGVEQGLGLVLVRLRDTMSTAPGESAERWVSEAESEASFTVPDVFRDNAKYLTWGELRELRTKPERINWVDRERRDTAFALASREAIAEMTETLAKSGSIELTNDRGQRVTLRAARLDAEQDGAWKLAPRPAGDIEVEIRRGTPSESLDGEPATPPAQDAGDRAMFLSAQEGRVTLDVVAGAGGRRLGIALELKKVRTRAGEGRDVGLGLERNDFPPIKGLVLQSKPEERLLSLPTSELLSRANANAGADPRVAGEAGELSNAIRRLNNTVTSKQHERWAMAVSAAVMVLTGAITSLRFSRSQPLTVYLWTFFPFLACLITINGGQQTVAGGAMWGIGFLWLGVAALAAYAGTMYVAVAKH